MSDKGAAAVSQAENQVIDRDLPIDWRQRAQDAWDEPGWREAAADYHRARSGRRGVVEIEPERLAKLRRLMADDILLDRASDEINRAARERYNGAPQATVEALAYELRTCDLTALEKPHCQRRLAEVSAAQLGDVVDRLVRLRPKYPSITDDLLLTLGDLLCL